MKLQIYQMRQKDFRDQISRIKAIANELNMRNVTVNTETILTEFLADVFRLVVVGEFSRGKSTFVNALLGRKILPASKNPTTAIISKIVYGDAPAYRIIYKNQGQEDLEEAAFKKLTAPPEPDESDPASVQEFVKAQKVISRIDFAEISYPLPFCRDKVEVVDTPGTNDLNVGRMEITYGYLNQADAVILLLAAYQPLTASEAQFLKERILGNQIQDIFFVISHKDDLDSVEQEKDVVGFIEKHLREVLPPGFNLQNRIFLVNSLGALYSHMKERGEELTAKQELRVPDKFSDTGFPDLEAALGDFLTNDKGMARLRKYNRDAQSVIQTMQHDLSVNIGIVSHSADEIRQKSAELAPKFQQAKRQAERIISDMKLSFESAGSDIDYKCHTAANEILSRAKKAVENLTKDMSASAMKQAIEREVTAEKKHFMDSTIKEWQKIFHDESEKAQTSLRSIWQDIDIEYQRSFQLSSVLQEKAGTLSLSAPGNTASFSEEAYRDAKKLFEDSVKKDDVLKAIGGIGVAAMIGTMGAVAELFGSLFGSRRETWRDKIRSEVVHAYSGQGDKMAKAFKAMYQSKVDAVCGNFEKQVRGRIEDMEQQLQNIIREKEAQEQDAEKRKSYLLAKQEELRHISQEMNRLVL